MAAEEEKRTFQKRAPSKQVLVKNLSKDLNRVSVVGTIVSKNDKILSFLLDDSTGTVNIIMNDADKFNQIKDGQVVRVFGKLWGDGDDIELQGDIVQDFTNFDISMYKQVFSSK